MIQRHVPIKDPSQHQFRFPQLCATGEAGGRFPGIFDLAERRSKAECLKHVCVFVYEYFGSRSRNKKSNNPVAPFFCVRYRGNAELRTGT